MTTPHNRDWVRRRGDCTPKGLLKRLQQRLHEDAEKLNGLPDDTRQYIDIEVCDIDKSGYEFTVMANFPKYGIGKVKLYSISVHRDGIDVYDHENDSQERRVITRHLDAKQVECTLLMDEEPVKLWQISRALLEHVVFRS